MMQDVSQSYKLAEAQDMTELAYICYERLKSQELLLA